MKQLIENRVEELLSGQYCLCRSCLQSNRTVFSEKSRISRYWRIKTALLSVHRKNYPMESEHFCREKAEMRYLNCRSSMDRQSTMCRTTVIASIHLRILNINVISFLMKISCLCAACAVLTIHWSLRKMAAQWQERSVLQETENRLSA